MRTETGVEVRVETFLRAQFSISPRDSGFAGDIDIFERGYVDSVGVVELLAFLAREFGVEVPEEDLLSDEFSTVAGIARIIRRLRAASGRPA
jgi:acyl carrier protein